MRWREGGGKTETRCCTIKSEISRCSFGGNARMSSKIAWAFVPLFKLYQSRMKSTSLQFPPLIFCESGWPALCCLAIVGGGPGVNP